MVTDFCSQRRTGAAGYLYVFGDPMFKSVTTDHHARARHKKVFSGQSGAFSKPRAEGGDQVRGERGDPLLSSFAVAALMCARSEMDIGRSGQLPRMLADQSVQRDRTARGRVGGSRSNVRWRQATR